MRQCDNISGLVAIAREASKWGLTLQIQTKARLAEITDQGSIFQKVYS